MDYSLQVDFLIALLSFTDDDILQVTFSNAFNGVSREKFIVRTPLATLFNFFVLIPKVASYSIITSG